MLLKQSYSLNSQWPADHKNLSNENIGKVAAANTRECFRQLLLADALTFIRLTSFG